MRLQSGYFEDAELCFDVLENSKFGFIHQILSCTRWENLSSVTTSSAGFGMIRLMRYTTVKQYGARYLSESEFRSCLSRAEREYYGLLASSLLKGRGTEFWKYHAKGLEQLGERIDWRRIILMLFPRLFDLVGNPKAAMETLCRRLVLLSRRKARSLRDPQSISSTVVRRTHHDPHTGFGSGGTPGFSWL